MSFEWFAFLAALFLIGCGRDSPQIPLVRNEPNCPVILFKSQATTTEIQAYIKEVTAPSWPSQRLFREGIVSLVKRERMGGVAYQVCFSDASSEQAVRDFVLSVETSKLVERVEVHPES